MVTIEKREFEKLFEVTNKLFQRKTEHSLKDTDAEVIKGLLNFQVSWNSSTQGKDRLHVDLEMEIIG